MADQRTRKRLEEFPKQTLKSNPQGFRYRMPAEKFEENTLLALLCQIYRKSVSKSKYNDNQLLVTIEKILQILGQRSKRTGPAKKLAQMNFEEIVNPQVYDLEVLDDHRYNDEYQELIYSCIGLTPRVVINNANDLHHMPRIFPLWNRDPEQGQTLVVGNKNWMLSRKALLAKYNHKKTRPRDDIYKHSMECYAILNNIKEDMKFEDMEWVDRIWIELYHYYHSNQIYNITRIISEQDAPSNADHLDPVLAHNPPNLNAIDWAEVQRFVNNTSLDRVSFLLIKQIITGETQHQHIVNALLQTSSQTPYREGSLYVSCILYAHNADHTLKNIILKVSQSLSAQQIFYPFIEADRQVCIRNIAQALSSQELRMERINCIKDDQIQKAVVDILFAKAGSVKVNSIMIDYIARLDSKSREQYVRKIAPTISDVGTFRRLVEYSRGTAASNDRVQLLGICEAPRISLAQIKRAEAFVSSEEHRNLYTNMLHIILRRVIEGTLEFLKGMGTQEEKLTAMDLAKRCVYHVQSLISTEILRQSIYPELGRLLLMDKQLMRDILKTK